MAALAGVAAAAMLAIPPAAAAPPQTLTPEAIDEYLAQAMDESDLPGVSVVVTRDGEIVHAAGYGHDSNGDALTADSPMRVASLTKSFTAAAVLTLVDDGKIALDDPVADQLPEFSMADPRAEQITVRQLLNQTSGLADPNLDVDGFETTTTLQQYVSRLKTGTLTSKPGTRWEYCNTNYNLAARLIEVAGGKSFIDYLDSAVFAPLGMDDSADTDARLKPADGYNQVFGIWFPRPEISQYLNGSGSGGIVTTANDMGKWLISQSGDGTQILSPESLELQHAPSKVDDYAMGWGTERSGRLTHSGNLMTYNAAQMLVPGTGYGVAVMANGAPMVDDTYTIAEGLLALSEGKTPQGPGSGLLMTNLVLIGLSLAAIGLAAAGIIRSRRWAGRRQDKPVWRLVLRLIPAAIPVLIFAAYPHLVAALIHRHVTWAQLVTFPASLSAMLLTWALAAAAVIVIRLLRWRSVRSNP